MKVAKLVVVIAIFSNWDGIATAESENQLSCFPCYFAHEIVFVS